MLKKIIALFKNKYFTSFFIIAILVYFINLIFFIGDDIYQSGARIIYPKTYPWILIFLLHLPEFILSRILPDFLGDIVLLISIPCLGFMYGYLGLAIERKL